MSEPDDWSQDSEFLKKRTTFNQDHKVMLDQSRRHFRVPVDVPGNRTHFSYYLWLTQIQQGRCLSTSFEKQRRGRSLYKTVLNMGSIYWQINTNWQAPSWSTLDYSGNWKPSHNMIEKTFADTMLSPVIEKGVFKLWAISDHFNTKKVSVRIALYNFT